MKLSGVIFVLSACLLAFLYGLATMQFKIFPYEIVREVKNGFDALRLMEDDTHAASIEYFDAAAAPTPQVTRHSDRAGREALLITGGFYQYMDRCPTFGCLAWIMDRDGKVLHTWEVDPAAILGQAGGFRGELNDFNIYPIGLALAPDGSLAVTFQARNTFPYRVGIARIAKDGSVLWSKLDYSHHWIDMDAAGNIYANSSKVIDLPGFVENTAVATHCPVGTMDYEGIRVHAPDGTVVRDLWMPEVLAASGWSGLLYSVRSHCDPIHINSIQLVRPDIAAALPGVAVGDILISLREPGAVGILDPETGRVKRMLAGQTAGQHSPKFFPDGTVAVFDNQGGDRALGGSRIVRLNLITGEQQLLFPRKPDGPAMPFFAKDAGHLSVSPGGERVLVTSTYQARIFEFDVATGEVLWEMAQCTSIVPYLTKFDLTADADKACYRSFGAYYVQDLTFLAARN
jgi:hypothetical protein